MYVCMYVYSLFLVPRSQLAPMHDIAFMCHIYIYTYVCMCVCMYVCIYIYIYIYIYIHIYCDVHVEALKILSIDRSSFAYDEVSVYVCMHV